MMKALNDLISNDSKTDDFERCMWVPVYNVRKLHRPPTCTSDAFLADTID